MIRLSLQATNAEILDTVRDWVELLAQERYNEAFQMLYHPENDYWTAELIRTVVANYGSIEPLKGGSTYRVTSLTDRSLTQHPNPYQNVWRYGDNAQRDKNHIGDVHFGLPLNGEWSDLTAIFNIVRLNDTLTLQLDDIHVL
jgi:hypothetical protein